MPTPAMICQDCSPHTPIYVDDPRTADHAGHLVYNTVVWHDFEMWNHPAYLYCIEDQRLHVSWRSKRCTCPQEIKFGRDEPPKKGCKLHGKPWQEKYDQWLAFQPFEKELQS